MSDHAVMPLPDPRLASIERRLTLVTARVDAIAEIVAPHPNAAAQRAKSDPGLGDAVIAVRQATDVLNHALRRLIERAAP